MTMDGAWRTDWKRFIKSSLGPTPLKKYSAVIPLQGSICSSVDMMSCISFSSFIYIYYSVLYGQVQYTEHLSKYLKTKLSSFFCANCESILSQKIIFYRQFEISHHNGLPIQEVWKKKVVTKTTTKKKKKRKKKPCVNLKNKCMSSRNLYFMIIITVIV